MEPFTEVSSIATPLRQENIDTDMIIPASFLKTVSRTGLGKGCFYTLRFDERGALRNSGPFDMPPFKGAQILLAGDNFGCGSSREHAVWALMDLGFRCIIAPSFADIFANNAMKNGMLLITLPPEEIDAIETHALRARAIGVDLRQQTITLPDSREIRFEIEDFRKDRLLEGLDEIDLTLQDADRITAFEDDDRKIRPWLYKTG